MKADRCDICQGRGSVNLPVSSPVQLVDDFTPQVSSRKFACPQCGPSVPVKRLQVVSSHSVADTRIDDPEYMRAVLSRAAHDMVAELLSAGMIGFRRGPDQAPYHRYTVVASLGVVAPADVGSIEARIAARSTAIVNEAAGVAYRSLAGSGYAPHVRAEVIVAIKQTLAKHALDEVMP